MFLQFLWIFLQKLNFIIIYLHDFDLACAALLNPQKHTTSSNNFNIVNKFIN